MAQEKAVVSHRGGRLSALEFAIDALAAYRLMRLVAQDTLTEEPRRRAQRWADEHYPLLAEGIECPWCVGVWAGFTVRLLPRWLRYALAVSALVGLLGVLEGMVEDADQALDDDG